MIIKWHGVSYECAHAVQGYDWVKGYDAQYNEVCEIINIRGEEWDNISLEGGEWESSVPTQQEILRADVDYLLMLQE